MKKYLLPVLLFLSFTPPPGASMAGLRVYDPENSLKKIKLHVSAHDNMAIKYTTDNGNSLSVTAKEGRIVFMENDWSHKNSGAKPLCTNFLFGKTSLRAIRAVFGNNGFTYTARNDLKTETDFYEFNCFDVAGNPNVALVVVTGLSLQDAEKCNKDNLSDMLLLEALILADKKYLDEVWDNDKLYDPKNKPVKLDR